MHSASLKKKLASTVIRLTIRESSFWENDDLGNVLSGKLLSRKVTIWKTTVNHVNHSTGRGGKSRWYESMSDMVVQQQVASRSIVDCV